MVSHQWPVALVVIWHIYSCLACSSEDSARDLPSSGKVVLGQGQFPCEFWVDWLNFIFQPVAPDMIVHIYSGQCCFKRVLGMDLLSSGDVALMMGQVPCEFWANQPTFIFQPAAIYVIWHIYLHLYCSLRDGGRDLPCSGEAAPTMGKSPLWVLGRSVNVPNHIRSHQLKNEGWLICLRLTGDLPHGRSCLPEDGKSLPPSLEEQ